MANVTYYRSEQLEIIHLSDKPACYSEHNHVTTFTIGLVLEGNALLRSSGKTILYSANSYFVIKPYQVHALLLPEQYTMLSICVHKQLVLNSNSAELSKRIQDLLQPILPAGVGSLLAMAVQELYQDEIPWLPDRRIMVSAHAVWSRPEEELCIDEMAKAVFFSKYHYIKLFKENVGLTPHKFQLQNRVRKAQRLLEDDLSSTEIATALGFCDQSHFIKCFKRVVGLTPSEYRQSICKIQ